MTLPVNTAVSPEKESPLIGPENVAAVPVILPLNVTEVVTPVTFKSLLINNFLVVEIPVLLSKEAKPVVPPIPPPPSI